MLKKRELIGSFFSHMPSLFHALPNIQYIVNTSAPFQKSIKYRILYVLGMELMGRGGV